MVAMAALLIVRCAEPVHLETSWPVGEGTVEIDLRAATQASADKIVAMMRSSMGQAETAVSFRAEEGELYRLNRQAADDYYRVSNRDLYRTLLLALDWARTSHGAYDPTLGPLTRLYTRHWLCQRQLFVRNG